jgi:hypothetical protein
MLRRLIKETTYDRWLDVGNLYGISRYSLVCLSEGPNLKKPDDSFAYDVTRQHVRGIYQQMAAIILAQKASVIQFSNRVNCLSTEMVNQPQEPKSRERRRLSQQVGQLHRDYINFISRLWFRDVTPQEQGIEMYGMAFGLAGQEKSMEDLRNEIKELYEYVGMENDRAEDDKIRVLTVMGAVFLPVGLVAALFSMDPSLITWLAQKLWSTVKGQTSGSIQTFVVAHKPWLMLMTKAAGVLIVVYGALALARRLIRLLPEKSLEVHEYLYPTKLLAILLRRGNK